MPSAEIHACATCARSTCVRVLDAETELRAAREQLRQSHADYAQARSMLAAQFAAETLAWQQKVEVKNATLRQLAECAQSEQRAQSRLRDEWAAARREFETQLQHCKTSNECVAASLPLLVYDAGVWSAANGSFL